MVLAVAELPGEPGPREGAFLPGSSPGGELPKPGELIGGGSVGATAVAALFGEHVTNPTIRSCVDAE